MSKLNLKIFSTKFNFVFFAIIFFLVLFFPVFYFQQDFLLSLSPVFLNSSILSIAFVVFLPICIYFIHIRHNIWTSTVFTFLIICYILLTTNAQNTINQNIYLGNCGNSNNSSHVYKKSNYSSGTITKAFSGEILYTYSSGDWNMSIVKSRDFGLQKVAILGIQEDWLVKSNLIKYKYNDQKFLEEMDTWTIFETPHSTAWSANFDDKETTANLDKSEFANCPELALFIEKQYNIILTTKTLEKIKTEYSIQQTDPRKFRKP